MAELALVTARAGSDPLSQVLPALDLLPHRVQVLGPDPSGLLRAAEPEIVLVDATQDLARARTTTRTLDAMGLTPPVVAVFGEGGLTVVDERWLVADFLLTDAAPAEVEARLRLVRARAVAGPDRGTTAGPLRVADVVVDEDSWTARAGGMPLDLTFKEFELLRFLLAHAGRVVTREHLLQEVWGMDYYGGTRTVDVHVRRLRAKLGPERESLIATIRGVGYRLSGQQAADHGSVVQ